MLGNAVSHLSAKCFFNMAQLFFEPRIDVAEFGVDIAATAFDSGVFFKMDAFGIIKSRLVYVRQLPEVV